LLLWFIASCRGAVPETTFILFSINQSRHHPTIIYTQLEQELLALVEHTSSPLDFSWLRVPPSLDFCVVFCRFSFFRWPMCYVVICKVCEAK
jgi:hypothetical protein